jgi:hypothetical protein
MADLVQAVKDLVIQDPAAPADPDPANQLVVEVCAGRWNSKSIKRRCSIMQTFEQACTMLCWDSAQRHWKNDLTDNLAPDRVIASAVND